MSFAIISRQFGNYSLYELTDLGSQTKIGIVPSCGALLNNFIVDAGGKAIDVINGYKSGDDLDENVAKNFKGVILSPFANRVNRAAYTYNNSDYVLDKVWKDKDYAIHGYLFNQRFQVVGKTATDHAATLILNYKYDGTLPGFPFMFETSVVYTLNKDNQLTCQTTIQNTGNQSMPLSFGWHPLFFNDVAIADVELKFPAVYKVAIDEDYIPYGEKIPYLTFNNARKIDDTVFDYCFRLGQSEDVAQADSDNTTVPADVHFDKTVMLFEPSNKIKVELGIQTGDNKFRYLQIYIPPQRNTIALEPMSSWPDAFNNKQDLISLQPSQTAEMNFRIKVSTL